MLKIELDETKSDLTARAKKVKALMSELDAELHEMNRELEVYTKAINRLAALAWKNPEAVVAEALREARE